MVAELRMLRQQPGRSVRTWGSTDLLQTLLKDDLIDEYRLFIFPVVLGSGRFERRGKPEYGTIGA